MVLRQDERQFMIYDPNVVDAVFRVLDGASIVMFGVWLQQVARRSPGALSDNLGTIGAAWIQFGEARQEINAGLAPNDVPDELAHAQRMWNVFLRWNADPRSVSLDEVAGVVDQFAGAIAYLSERTMDTGTHHPRYNSLLVAGVPCESCGR